VAGAVLAGAAIAAAGDFLRGLVLRGGLDLAVLAARLDGESEFFDFINAGVRGEHHKRRQYGGGGDGSQPQISLQFPMKLLAKQINWRLNQEKPSGANNMSQSNAAQASGEGGSKTLIFVVDDAPMLVEFAAMVLQSAGWEVKQFTEPGPVLKALGEGGLRPALLLTDYDLGLRAMNGLDLILNSHKIYPEMKAVLASGTVDGSVMLHHAAKVDRFLNKPYPPAQLKALVAELLK